MISLKFFQGEKKKLEAQITQKDTGNTTNIKTHKIKDHTHTRITKKNTKAGYI